MLDTSGQNGISFCHFRDTRVKNAKIGLHLKTTISGWINGNTFENILLDQSAYHIRLEAESGTTKGTNRNFFKHVIGQSLSGYTRAGLDADTMVGTSNEFDDVKFWDLAGSGVFSTHIKASV